MSKSIQIHIPQPCHENWNKMTGTDKGRFCLSCQKEVVDFSLMSDQQVLHYISKASSGVCGRFAEPQLNRDMILKKERKLTWFKYVMHVIIPAMLITNKASAQRVKITGDTIVCTTPQLLNIDESPSVITVGALVIDKKIKPNSIIIDGKVSSKEGEPLPGATIMVKGSRKGVSADGNGLFHLKVTDETKKIILTASSVGFETKEMRVDLNKITDTLKIEMSLQASIMGLGEVVYVTRKKNKTDTLQLIKNGINNIINKETVKVYPNPVSAGSTFTIDFDMKDAGEYSVYIMNISGHTVLQKKIISAAKTHREQITCDSRMPGDMYIVQVINMANKKVYNNKIIVK